MLFGLGVIVKENRGGGKSEEKEQRIEEDPGRLTDSRNQEEGRPERQGGNRRAAGAEGNQYHHSGGQGPEQRSLPQGEPAAGRVSDGQEKGGQAKHSHLPGRPEGGHNPVRIRGPEPPGGAEHN